MCRKGKPEKQVKLKICFYVCIQYIYIYINYFIYIIIFYIYKCIIILSTTTLCDSFITQTNHTDRIRLDAHPN